jgi:uncharacterized protein YjbI with pentapeptide repeats
MTDNRIYRTEANFFRRPPALGIVSCMANADHIAKLMGGVESWNRWRKENPEVVPDLARADLAQMDLSRYNLSRCNLCRGRLSGSNLTSAYLVSAELRESHLREADMQAAYLSLANMQEANLSWANLSGADLFKANLTGSHLIGTNIRGAQIGWTVFGDVDLSATEGLEEVFHRGPSIIGIDTLYRSEGAIPEVFLRGAGIPETFVFFSRSLVTNPIQFYSCFISYSTPDQDFADRLHADLQNKGVRCWFAPEDLKIGDKFRSRIDESIHVFDKLLLILSQHSIASPWVEDEVEAALERERRESRLVLFPIRLDNAIMQTDIAWASHLRQKRHIGNFCGWNDHDKHQKAFERLLRDLKADVAEHGPVPGAGDLNV